MEDDDDEETDALNGVSISNGISYDDDDVLPNGDDQPIRDSILERELAEDDGSEQQPGIVLEHEESETLEPATTSGANEAPKKRGRAPKAVVADPEESVSASISRPRGRPSKKAKAEVHQDEEKVQPMGPPPAVKGRSDKLSQRDPNGKIKGAAKTGGKLPLRAPSVGSRSGFVPRSATPANDNGAVLTRSGRQSIKPLASWRGERVVYDDRYSDSLPAIKEVVRVDEVVEPRPKSHYRRGQHRAKSQLANFEEEDEDKAPWEKDVGIMHAQVMDWDPILNKFDEDITWEQGMSAVTGLQQTDTEPKLRGCVLVRSYRNARYQQCRFQICQNPDSRLLWVWHGRSTTWRCKTCQKLEKDANGLFRLLWTR